jgi:cyanophycin synthetase
MGVKIENIRHGLRTFDTTYFQAPGRLNVFDELPFKVILDYGHNPAAMQAMAELVSKLGVTGRRILVLGVPGDRRNEDAVAMCEIAAKAFDHVIVRQDDDRRGRADGELPKLIEEALLRAGLARSKVEVLAEEPQAVDHALRMAKRGDLLLVLADKVNRSWKQITKFGADGTGGPKSRPAGELPSMAQLVEERMPLDSAPTLDGEAVIRDERGVRIARTPDAED